jgi:hypothetical protein
VGREAIGGPGVTVGERWNGSSWSLQSTPNPPNPPAPTPDASLAGVSCPASTTCLAVGKDQQSGKALGQAWNGSKWEALFAKESGFEGSRSGIVCTSANQCVVVGSAAGAAKAELWTYLFGEWTRSAQSVPSPEGGSEVKLNDVSCTSSSACTAVGSYVKEGKTKTLAERWGGSSWAIQSTPNPESGSAELLGVSCDSSSSCTAVGKQGSNSYAMRWNGTSWSTTTVPGPSGATSSALLDVSCGSSSGCMAVGSYVEAGVTKTLAERWSGTSWSVSSTSNPSGSNASLSAVSCTTTSSCVAVGNSVISTTEAKTLVEAWDGSGWGIQSSPNPEGKSLSSLLGVSCSGATACTGVGVGREAIGGPGVTVGERYE